MILLMVVLSAEAQAQIWPTDVAEIERNLSSDAKDVRLAATEHLERLPRRVLLRVLPRLLGTGDVDVRLAAATAAHRAGYERATSYATAWLSDQDKRLRVAAAHLLREFPNEKSAEALGRALGDADVEVRLAASAALGRLRSAEAALALIQALDDRNPRVQDAVLMSLARVRPVSALVPLMTALQSSPRVSTRRLALRALGRLGVPEVMPPLVLALNDTEAEVRAAAARALRLTQLLRRIGPRSVGAASQASLLSAIDAAKALGRLVTVEDDARVLLAVVRALGEFDAHGGATFLELALDHPRPGVRDTAIIVLRAVARRRPELLAGCLARARTPRGAQSCVRAMPVNPSDVLVRPVIEAFRAATVDAYTAIGALGRASSVQALTILLESLQSPSPRLRSRAAGALRERFSRIGGGERAVEPLLDALRGPEVGSEERMVLIRLLGMTRATAAAQPLGNLLRRAPSTLERAALLRALSLIPAHGQDSLLVQLLQSAPPALATEAALALRTGGSPRFLPALMDGLRAASPARAEAWAMAIAGPARLLSSKADHLALVAQIKVSGGALQDILLEALVNSPLLSGEDLLPFTLEKKPAVRRKVAELGRHLPFAALGRLARDEDATVRANALRALTHHKEREAESVLVRAAAGKELDVAANAVLGLAERPSLSASAVEAICRAGARGAEVLSVNSLAALTKHPAACAEALALSLLATDRSALVRQAAARVLLSPRVELARPAKVRRLILDRFLNDPSSDVSAACGPKQEPAVASDSVPRPVRLMIRRARARTSQSGGAFRLQLANGAIRQGRADRSGAVLEWVRTPGALRLLSGTRPWLSRAAEAQTH